MHLLLAKNAKKLLPKYENEAMELSYKVENQSLTALVRVCGKALHVIGSDATCKFMKSVYILRWLIGSVVPSYFFI